MPRHQQITTCRLTGGPISRQCTCEHCNLSMCEVCGASEAGLTTDCPDSPVAFDRQREVAETCLDYTSDRGWHQGGPVEHRAPRFTSTRLPPKPPRMDPRAVVEPNINWDKIDRNTALQHQLTLQAISWVLADRECDDLSATLTRARDTANPQLEKVQTHFQRACRRVEECDDELRQAARKLVDALEEGSPDDPRTSP